MRPASLLAALALLGAACRESVTEPSWPSRTVADAAPSGIPVASTRGSWNYDANLFDASVTTAGDSAVLTYVSAGGCGHVFEASAGIVDGALVVTNVGRVPEDVDGCLSIANRGGAPFRLVVRPLARGRLAVVLRERTQNYAPARTFLERDILRRTVTLP